MKIFYKSFFKRALDLIFALVLFPFTFILFIFLAPIILLSDGSPIFYKSERLGRNGKIFWMYKFRSMTKDAVDIRNSDGSTFNSKNDPRVTRIGRFLRSTSLDELPQIINVFIGDMSFIGPRPDLPEHLNTYEEMHKRKLIVRPGITGYNQAYFRNSIEWKCRLDNDVYYADNISFKLDCSIFLKTIQIVLLRKNVYSDNSKNEKEN
ncbi:MAG TPA: sugar transferase [Bacilli bacterium]|nr:sugar transferase [Bacilli bacterium]